MHQPVHDKLDPDGDNDKSHDTGDGVEAAGAEHFEQKRRYAQAYPYKHGHCHDMPVGVLDKPILQRYGSVNNLSINYI